MSTSRRAVLLAALVLVALPSSAAAKGVTAVKMCGSSGCIDVTSEARVLAMEGGPGTDPPAGAPFYTLRVGIGEPDADGREAITRGEFTMLYVPAAGVLRGPDGTWMAPGDDRLARLEGRVGAQWPWPAARLPKLAPEIGVIASGDASRGSRAAAAAAETGRDTSSPLSPGERAAGASGGGLHIPAAALAGAGAAVLAALLAAMVLRRRGTEAQA